MEMIERMETNKIMSVFMDGGKKMTISKGVLSSMGGSLLLGIGNLVERNYLTNVVGRGVAGLVGGVIARIEHADKFAG